MLDKSKRNRSVQSDGPGRTGELHFTLMMYSQRDQLDYIEQLRIEYTRQRFKKKPTTTTTTTEEEKDVPNQFHGSRRYLSTLRRFGYRITECATQLLLRDEWLDRRCLNDLTILDVQHELSKDYIQYLGQVCLQGCME